MNLPRFSLLIGAVTFAAGCGDIIGTVCTDELRPNLIVEVREAVTGKATAFGVTGAAHHSDGERTELSATDSLTLNGSWSRERAGGYTIQVRKPGYTMATADARVNRDRCHVEPRRVQLQITPDPAALVQNPIRFASGNKVNGWPASAGIRVHGDTLEIIGSAPPLCSELRAVAIRSRDELHVQLEPVEWAGPCGGPSLQLFEATYQLPAGNSYLLVTSAVGTPAVLFQGLVQGG